MAARKEALKPPNEFFWYQKHILGICIHPRIWDYMRQMTPQLETRTRIHTHAASCATGRSLLAFVCIGEDQQCQD